MDAGSGYKNPALAVSRARADAALTALLRARLLDGSRRSTKDEREVLLPVLVGSELARIAAEHDARVVEATLPAREPRRTPHEEVLALLPDALRPLAPDKWEKLGDVVVLRLPEPSRPHARALAPAYAEALGARCVVLDPTGVEGELREMRGELLLGDDPVTTHVENGVRYRLDASRIMFSSGNVHERKRASQLRAPGETVVDMFAGIGYFTLPVAMRSGAARVVALEKNPLSYRFLQENAALNAVAHVVEPWLGDNREFPHEGIADRVLMGYFPGTAAFLPKAFRLLKPEGGRIHYHDTAHERTWKDELTRALLAAARGCGRVVAVEEARVVKTHSPGVVHAVLVAQVHGSGVLAADDACDPRDEGEARHVRDDSEEREGTHPAERSPRLRGCAAERDEARGGEATGRHRKGEREGTGPWAARDAYKKHSELRE